MTHKDNLVSSNLNKSTPQDPYVIGIGASAGGLQALDALFENIPRDSVAYVIVQHLSPEHKSLLKEVLSKHKQLQFREAEQNMPIEINNVYVIPAGKQITLKRNHLQVTDRVLENATSRTINTFFNSLAQDKKHRCVGIILSGTGTDGTEGIMAIKKAKGLVLVQDPETAKFDGMPRSAINSGYVDMILAPSAMPDEIFNYVKVNPLTDELSVPEIDSDPAFLQILNMVRDRSGVDFSNYKRPTIIRRISRRMAGTNTSKLVDYLDYLHLHPDEVETLSKEFLIGVTKFFRDTEAFKVIEKEVIPALVAHKTISDQLRVWVAGCSSGEEAYSLAILIREHLDEVEKELEVKIFASDIDREALEFAGKGLYPEGSLSEISNKRKRAFFVKEENKYRITQRVRRMVIFAPHNIVNDAPFSKIDLVSCRNMLIYLSPMLQKKVIAKFHYALNVGGFLFLGSSESIGDQKHFTEVNKKWKIFKNTQVSRALGMENFGSTDVGFRLQELQPVAASRQLTHKLQQTQSLTELLNDSILEEYGYAAVYVDENYELVHGFGHYIRYLSLPNRNFTLNILKLVSPELALNVGNMLRRVIRDKVRTTAQGLLVRDGETQRHVNITIKPILPEKKTEQKLFLILFNEDLRQELPQTSPQVFWNEAHYENRVTELELELQSAKEDLQSVVEELETANEELQSTNEELLSSNEELQSTNEELQSLNEELHTVNAEHQYKIKLMTELDDDLNNYFRSTNIGQVFVDLDLLIRKFTQAATKQINLIESDIGRSISQISNNLIYDNLLEDITEVITRRKTVEHEIQHKNGRWYQMRILPYLNQENKIDGAIILFVEINELKRLQLMQQSILDSSPNAILALKAVRNNLDLIVDFECAVLNNQAKSLLNFQDNNPKGKPMSKAYPGLLQNGLLEKYVQLVNEGKSLNLDHLQENMKGEKQWLHLTGVKMEDGLVLTIQDITSRKKYEEEQLEHQAAIIGNAERFRTLLEAVPHITWTNKPTGENISFNQAWYDYTGLSEAESVDWGWQKAFHPDDLKVKLTDYEKGLQTGEVISMEARILYRKDNQYRWHLIKNVPLRDENGALYLWIGTATDIQDHKDAEAAAIKLKVAQQREILHTILRTQEAERSRISEALHNGLGQLLYATKLHLNEIQPENTDRKKIKSHIEELVDQAISTTRQISFELTPSILKDFGLKTAIDELITRLQHAKLKVTAELEGLEERLDYVTEISVYRIIQELLNNILKHAQATEAFIELTLEKGLLRLHVQDNGIGLDKETTTLKGIGLNSIKNRVEVLNGQLKIDSRKGRGTVFEITCRVKNS